MSDENKPKEDNRTFLNKAAESFGRDIDYAVSPGLGWLFNTAKDFTYRGQSIEHLNKVGEEGVEKLNKEHNVLSAPDLLGIYTGSTTPEDQGLILSDSGPKGGYPWSEEAVIYDASPYINFKGFKGSPESLFTLENKIQDMSSQDIISYKDLQGMGIDVDHYSSVDFGRINWSIGRDEETGPYLAMADTWDFKNMEGIDYIPGKLMEKYGKGKDVKDMGFYGRFNIDSNNYNME